MRVIAEHSRSATFLIADGVVPSNEGRGYVLRRVMRRAIRNGMTLGINGIFLGELVDVVIEQMGSVYPELKSNEEQSIFNSRDANLSLPLPPEIQTVRRWARQV